MWENNEIQFARLLCELMAADYNVTDAAKSMDLEVGDINELLDRAHEVFEAAKIDGPRDQYEFEANEPNERYWLGIQVKPGVRIDVGVLHNDDGISIDVWKNSEDSPRSSMWLSWDDLLAAEDLSATTEMPKGEKDEE